jgi:AcrR family transcriptional regulator
MTSKGERTRQAVLDAAVERFAREGYRATSVADVARDVQVSSAAVFSYFPSKEALFVAAVDQDAAGVVEQRLIRGPATTGDGWPTTMLLDLLGALDRHPLARRILSGLEPEYTTHLLAIPALEQVRKEVCELLRTQQAAGLVRSDIDAEAVAGGLVHLTLSLLMSMLQTGTDAVTLAGQGIAAVFDAALRPPTPDR